MIFILGPFYVKKDRVNGEQKKGKGKVEEEENIEWLDLLQQMQPKLQL